MPTAPVIDFDKLLTPIAGDNPSGEDISTTGIISEIKELRRADEAASNYGEWQPKELKMADWPKAIKLANEALINKTKDLRIAAYLVECITKVHGAAGLRDGLRLYREFHVQFWDTVHPIIEDGDVDFRAGAVSMLDSMVPMRLREQKITKSMGGAVYSQLDWEDSKRVDEFQRAGTEASQAAYDQAMADGKVNGEMFRKAVGTTPKSFYEKLVGDLDEAMEELKQTNLVIEEKYGEAGAYDIPVLSQIKATLETSMSMISEIEKLIGPLRAVPLDGSGSSDEATETTAAAPVYGGGAAAMAFSGPGVPLDPVDREDALKRLNAVANYFRRHEPHSPVAYLVDRAVTWGQMPLEKWLEEVVKDTTTLGSIRELLGIKAPDGY